MRQGFTLIELMIVIAIIAIIAAIAIPNLLESRVTANEAAASASLKSGVFAGEVQFQGGGYQDADGDNIGEYGTLGMLAGRDPTSKMAVANNTTGLNLLQGPLTTPLLAQTSRSASGYLFLGCAPGLTTLASVTTTQLLEGDSGVYVVAAPSTSNNGEKHFTIGCMPEKYGDSGRRLFMLSEDGQIRSPALAANINVWFGGVAPTAGLVGTIALIKAGLADSVATSAGVAPAFVNAFRDVTKGRYPTYSK